MKLGTKDKEYLLAMEVVFKELVHEGIFTMSGDMEYKHTRLYFYMRILDKLRGRPTHSFEFYIEDDGLEEAFKEAWREKNLIQE